MTVPWQCLHFLIPLAFWGNKSNIAVQLPPFQDFYYFFKCTLSLNGYFFFPFLDIVSLTYALFLPQRDLGPPVTFDCKHCQACQEVWVDHAQITLSSGKGHTSNSHTAMNQLYTKLLLVKPNKTFMIYYINILPFKNTPITLHIVSVMVQERDMPFEVCKRDIVSFYRWNKSCLDFLCIFSQTDFSLLLINKGTNKGKRWKICKSFLYFL